MAIFSVNDHSETVDRQHIKQLEQNSRGFGYNVVLNNRKAVGKSKLVQIRPSGLQRELKMKIQKTILKKQSQAD